MACLLRHEARNDRIDVPWVVPELPVAARVVSWYGGKAWDDWLLVSVNGGQQCYWRSIRHKEDEPCDHGHCDRWLLVRDRLEAQGHLC